jgi:hypothetical protein
MTARVEINPNLRFDDVYTMVDLDHDVDGEIGGVFDLVVVYESESGLLGRGWITDIDLVDRTVTVQVDWANLVLDRAPSSDSRSPLHRGEANSHLVIGRSGPVASGLVIAGSGV